MGYWKKIFWWIINAHVAKRNIFFPTDVMAKKLAEWSLFPVGNSHPFDSLSFLINSSSLLKLNDTNRSNNTWRHSGYN